MENNQELFKTLRSYKKELEEKGYNVVYVGLYGSQNYDLHDENSDVDARAIVLPSVRDLIKRKSISSTVEVSNGLVDVKDLMSFLQTLKKGNPAYIESAVTPVYIGDKKVRAIIEQFKVKPIAIYGMMMEKLKAIEKGLPAPASQALGYDPKQFHHIIRLMEVLREGYLSGELKPYLKCSGMMRNELIRIKRDSEPTEHNSKEIIMGYAQRMCELASDLVKNKMTEYEEKEIPEEAYAYLENSIVESVFKPNPTFSARAHRTFNNGAPKRDLADFPALEELQGRDISYTVYSYVEITDNGGKDNG